MMISILIPVKADNKYLRECIEICLRLDYTDFEVIVLPDEEMSLPYKDKVKIIPTGKVGPALKRDMAVDKARGEILAFLDDDVFPEEDWLKNAVHYFENLEVAAVCGPAVTPAGDDLSRKASGIVYSSFLVSGGHSRRYAPRYICEVDDYPSCNFLVRKEIFKKVGGFDTNFWPGEDTVLCLKITKELKKKIIYDPRVLVYHHRRPLFKPHLDQVKSYGLHRGYFVKKFPKTSLRVEYFLPSLFVLWLAIGAILSVLPAVRAVYLSSIFVYLALIFLYSAAQGNLKLNALVFFGIITTHLTYGFYFIKGLFTKKLTEE